MKNEGAADCKATHGAEYHGLYEFCAQMQGRWEKRPYGKDDTCNIEPHWRSEMARFVLTKLNLQQHRGRTNQGHDDQRHRAAKRRRTGEHHYQSQGDAEKSRAKYGFAFRQWQGNAIV